MQRLLCDSHATPPPLPPPAGSLQPPCTSLGSEVGTVQAHLAANGCGVGGHVFGAGKHATPVPRRLIPIHPVVDAQRSFLAAILPAITTILSFCAVRTLVYGGVVCVGGGG